jgi:hypothetical protein
MGFEAETTPIVGGRYLFQCKRFAPDNLVGSAALREFYGALIADRKAAKGVFITTSTFTPQARQFAEGLAIELIDGDQLRTLLADEKSQWSRSGPIGWRQVGHLFPYSPMSFLSGGGGCVRLRFVNIGVPE